MSAVRVECCWVLFWFVSVPELCWICAVLHCVLLCSSFFSTLFHAPANAVSRHSPLLQTHCVWADFADMSNDGAAHVYTRTVLHCTAHPFRDALVAFPFYVYLRHADAAPYLSFWVCTTAAPKITATLVGTLPPPAVSPWADRMAKFTALVGRAPVFPSWVSGYWQSK